MRNSGGLHEPTGVPRRWLPGSCSSSSRPARRAAVVGALRRAGWQPRCVRVAAPRSLTGALKNGRLGRGRDRLPRCAGLDVVETIAAVLAGDGDMPVVAVSGAPARTGRRDVARRRRGLPAQDRLGRLPATLCASCAGPASVASCGRRGRNSAKARKRFRTLVEATNQIVWTAGPDSEPDGRIDDWTAFTGRASRSSPGKGWLDAIHPDDRGARRRGLAARGEQRDLLRE